MTKAEAIEELLATADAGEVVIVRAWRDKANKCWKLSGTVGLTGGQPAVTVMDTELEKTDLGRLLGLIGET